MAVFDILWCFSRVSRPVFLQPEIRGDRRGDGVGPTQNQNIFLAPQVAEKREKGDPLVSLLEALLDVKFF